jgi:imidazole glycerol-phosphate synthase subunit HisH
VIAVIDYGSGNLPSIRRALQAGGAEVIVTDDPEPLKHADAVVLPGVGHAGHSVDRLRTMGFDRSVYDAVDSGKPLLGICVGMQVLFEDQEEGGGTGLGLIPGRVRSLRDNVKIPHMGWNRSRVERSGVFGESGDETYFYFVHSYVAEPSDPLDIVATTSYGERFASIVAHHNIWGTQFHPEKSGDDGLQLIKRFVEHVDAVRARQLEAIGAR